MKLIACHIENFGKLSNLTLQFSDGLNVINEANAWGKSTLAAFLKAMFYGLDAKKGAGAFEKERVMFRPWQGGAFGGEVDFEVDGRRYRVSRSFGITEKTDEFHLYDLRTNLECFDYSEELGNEIFELDSASFKRSIYIAQNDCGGGTSDGINAKLGNLAENTDDINNFENANKQLKDILNQLTPDRVTGSIKKRKNYITQLTQELRSFDAAQEGLEGIQRKEQLVSMQIQELQDIRRSYADALLVASEDSRRKALYAQYDEVCKEVEEKEKKKDSYKAIFPVRVPGEAEFQTQLQNVNKINEADTRVKSLQLTIDELADLSKMEDMFANYIPTNRDIDSALQMFIEIDKQKEEIARQESKLAMYQADLKEPPVEPKFTGSFAYKIFLFVGIGVALVGFAALAAWYFKLLPIVNSDILLVAAIITAGCGVVFGLVGLALGMRVSKERQAWNDLIDEQLCDKEDMAELIADHIVSMKEDVDNVYDTIGKFLASFHVYCEVSEYRLKLYDLKNQVQEFARLKEKRAAYENEKIVAQEIRDKVANFTSLYEVDFGDDYAVALNVLQNKATEYQMAEEAYKEACAKKEALEQSQEQAFWTRRALCPYSLEELNELLAQTDEKIEECKRAKNQYTKQLDDLQEQLDLRDEKENELRELHLSQEKDMAKYSLLKVTQEYLQLAKEKFTSRYMEPIARGFSKYYGMLTGEDSADWMIDANINLKVREYGELRETYWLSAGYQDLIGVCMRLALVDAMYQEEKPFLILDDTFVNLDQEKVKAGNELLQTVADEYQIIYFTCHNSRRPKKL